MKLDKTICRLWGHKFSLNAANLFPVDGGSEVVCVRCGKEHFQPSFYNNELNSSNLRTFANSELLLNREFTYQRQQDPNIDQR